MAGRDYIRCKSCDCKLVYDGDDNIRDDLDATYGTCDLICPSCLDALEIRLAKLEQAPAVEPAQAVPAFWASENVFKESLRDNISCILTTTRCSANTVPLYTVPPAIDETRHRLILVCEYLETVGLMFVSPRVISSQIRAILEAGNEN